MHPHIHYTLSFFAESSESLHHRKPPLGCRGSACVEVMTTLHRSTPSLRGRVRGYASLEVTIALTRDPFKSPLFLFQSLLNLIGELRYMFRIPFPTCGCI